MASEHIDKPNKDAIPDDSAKDKALISHYENVVLRLVDPFFRVAEIPSVISARLMKLLKGPKKNLKTNRNLVQLADLLNDKNMGKITQEVIEYYSPISSSLPRDVARNSIGRYLVDKKDRSALGATSFGLFRKLCSWDVLKFVTHGNESLARILVIRDSNTILEKSNVTDPGGRTFKDISPLQYAHWMRDWYMVDMLLSPLSKEQLVEAQIQIDEVKNGSVEYQLYLDLDDPNEEITAEALQKAEEEGKGKSGIFLDGRTPVILRQANVEYTISLPPDDYDYTKAIPIPEGKRRVLVTVKGEQHYDYQPLIVALTDYLPIHKEWEANGFNEGPLRDDVIHHWRKNVGGVQLRATVFLAQQYCHPERSFENVKFDEKVFKRTLEFYDYVKARTISWFLQGSGLGDSFGVTRARAPHGRPRGKERIGGWGGDEALVDIAAVKRLCEESLKNLASVEAKHFAGISPAMRPQ